MMEKIFSVDEQLRKIQTTAELFVKEGNSMCYKISLCKDLKIFTSDLEKLLEDIDK